ncbi:MULTISPECIES: glutathione S-transferase family protein [Aerococcus]|uniref:Glutathione S-transferase family protein n=1 Tax=Aerococcus sanguinicola TaxID=119206 RepID=A0A5N1GGT6_9LACT|nr:MULTISPECIES: glutathione S-transferase C-terminal domain-containing protein [Aerococcus]KAA9300175.1 glutathione S-transferase family protein [Aerococcus sanguinicola]MDK6369517.1 glutathione S-transferase C-terminal domain-containing protein [Aerococcus sp. UMB9870]MDK6680004.1 glutathione S-transferase C-terminal domain-containing protein [Aerococcus sp. UMB8608]MDK6686114.1 glutathione S-transferase C-terminal domain-containing protein [Aerococcus sp. UMB8623]MDK6939894.1 glutathione S-
MTKDHIARREDAHEISESGAFVRQKNRFDTPFGDGEGELPVEAGRYRLLWAPICPWAHRSVIARELLGLQDVISLGTAKPVRTDAGWDFSEDPNGGILPGSDYKYLPEIYAATDPDYQGRATVPTVVDTKTGKVVNNDYFNLTYYWEEEFKPFHKEGAPDLFPKALQSEIREFNDMLFNEVNNAVYKCGFAQSQEAYEENYDLLFNRLDQLEERLSKQRYLFGDQITDSDIRFYVTLARFDVSYYPEFKANRNRIIDFPNIWNYAKDLYQTPGFGSTTDFTQIKMGYSLGNVGHNPYHILAKGPDTSIWNEPHDRDRFN